MSDIDIEDILGTPAKRKAPPMGTNSPPPPMHQFTRALQEDVDRRKLDAQIEAIADKMKDKLWRLNNLYVILDEDGTIRPFKLRHEQLSFILNRHNRNFVPKARKLGMSTLIVIDYLDTCIFTPNSNVGVIDIKEDDACDKLAIAMFAWDNTDKHPNAAIRYVWQRLKAKLKLVSRSNGKMVFGNGSKYTAGVRYTGKTPVKLHISEYGPIAAQFPKVAEDIKRGSMNAVPKSGTLDIETTMEGGQIGECYAVFKLAKENGAREDLDELEWRMHFFSWLGHPSYTIKPRTPDAITAETREYFAKITARSGDWIEDTFGWKDGIVPDERQLWWQQKKKETGVFMAQQFPTDIIECDMAAVVGRIYPEFTKLRVEGRVATFNPEPGLPMVMSADLGSSANTALWLHQPTGKAHNVIDCAFGEGAGAAWVADTWRRWEREHGFIMQLLVPHDANITDKGGGMTYVQELVKARVPREMIVVVPRTTDVWVGINAVSRMLPNCWFHSRCDIKPRTEDGQELPSGVQRLENYRVKPTASSGTIPNTPLHDICSHAADAFRTYAEANEQFLVDRSRRVRTDEETGERLTYDTEGPVKVILQRP